MFRPFKLFRVLLMITILALSFGSASRAKAKAHRPNYMYMYTDGRYRDFHPLDFSNPKHLSRRVPLAKKFRDDVKATISQPFLKHHHQLYYDVDGFANEGDSDFRGLRINNLKDLNGYVNSKDFTKRRAKRKARRSFKRLTGSYRRGSFRFRNLYRHNLKRRPSDSKLKMNSRSRLNRSKNQLDYLNDDAQGALCLFSNGGLESLKDGNGYEYRRATGFQGRRVHILKRAAFDNQAFDQIYVPELSHDEWVDSANVSNSPSAVANDSISELINRIKVARTRFENRNSRAYEQQMADQTLIDLNRDRMANGLPILSDSNTLDQVARIRSGQLINHFGHYDNNHQLLYEIDAAQAGVNLGQISGENIASAELGSVNMNSDPKRYYNRNGNDMANMDEDSMMNYDSSQGNGHRDNILDPGFTWVGIGISYDSVTQTYYLAEDFSG